MESETLSARFQINRHMINCQKTGICQAGKVIDNLRPDLIKACISKRSAEQDGLALLTSLLMARCEDR